MNNVGQARGDQAQTDSATEHGQQLTLDSETQRGSESDDENAFPRYLRPHLGPIHQGVRLRCFSRLAVHALSSAMTHGPSPRRSDSNIPFSKAVSFGTCSFNAASARVLAAAMKRSVLSPESKATVPQREPPKVWISTCSGSGLKKDD